MTDPPPDTVAALTVPALLSISTVAKLLECSPRTVRRRIAEGVLPALEEHGRTMVRADDLLAYIERLQRIGLPPRRRPPARARRSPYPRLG
jgi:excisionase family DNA binding protein